MTSMPRVRELDQEAFTSDEVISISSLVKNGRLVDCPPFDASRQTKVLHHMLLIALYRDTRFCVPYHTTWNMPHIDSPPTQTEVWLANHTLRRLLDGNYFF